MMVVDEPDQADGPSPSESSPPPPTDRSQRQPPSSSLIISGKRSRRKVNLSAEYLYDPIRIPRSRAQPVAVDDDASQGDTAAAATVQPSPVHRKRRRSSSSKKDANAANSAELADKRNRLQQRKLELEGYLKRLQVALSVERNHAAGVGPPAAQLVGTACAAPANESSGSGGPNGVPDSLQPLPIQQPPRAAPAVRRRSIPSKKRESRAPLPVFDDDVMEISLKSCLRIIDDLLHNQYGDVFATPVDWVALGLPTYPEIVKQPMDLGTIRYRLTSSYYTTLTAFISDVQLVWDNAKSFNLPKSFVHEATMEMERIWNRKKDYMKRERRRALITGQNRDSTSVVEQQAPSPAAAMASTVDFARPLTFLEMSKLRADIGRIPPDQVMKIADIAGSSSQSDSSESRVVEIDLDKLSTETQRRLQQFVASLLPKVPARPRPPPPVMSSSDPQPPARGPASSVTSAATAVVSSDSDSDSSSSSGLDSESSDDDQVVVPNHVLSSAPPLPPAAHQPMEPSVEAEPAPEIVNTDAWTSLSVEEQPDESATAVQDGPDQRDPLWCDYQTMSAEAQQRERDRREQDLNREREQDRLAEERAALDEKARLDREVQEQKRVQEAAEREEERTRVIRQEREAARRALEHDETEGEDHADMGFLTSIFHS